MADPVAKPYIRMIGKRKVDDSDKDGFRKWRESLPQHVPCTYSEYLDTVDRTKLSSGLRVDHGRYEVYERIKESSYGDIYNAWDIETKSKNVMKLSKSLDASMIPLDLSYILKNEAAVLGEMYNSGSKHAVEFKGSGFLLDQPSCRCGRVRWCGFICGGCEEWVPSYEDICLRWIMMGQLGKSLSEIRKERRWLGMDEVIRIGKQCIQALEDLHGLGYVHRDVKSSNFAVGGTKETENIIYLLDYGLARRFWTKEGLRKPRPEVPFSGNYHYCSTSVYKGREPGRQDDLISLMYIMHEMIVGDVPPILVFSPEGILRRKSSRRHSREALHAKDFFERCPGELNRMLGYLNTLTYEDRPNYRKLKEWLEEIMERKGYPTMGLFDGMRQKHYQWEHRYYDWEDGVVKRTIQVPTVSLGASWGFSLPTETVKEIQTEKQVRHAENCVLKATGIAHRKITELRKKIDVSGRMMEGITDVQSLTLEDLPSRLNSLHEELLQREDEDGGSTCSRTEDVKQWDSDSTQEVWSGHQYPDVSESDEVEDDTEIDEKIEKLKKEKEDQEKRMEILQKELAEEEKETKFYKMQSNAQLKNLLRSLQNIKASIDSPMSVFYDKPGKRKTDPWCKIQPDLKLQQGKLNVPKATADTVRRVLFTMEVNLERMRQNFSSIEDILGWRYDNLHQNSQEDMSKCLREIQEICQEVIKLLEKRAGTEDPHPPSDRPFEPFQLQRATNVFCVPTKLDDFHGEAGFMNVLLEIETDLRRTLLGISFLEKSATSVCQFRFFCSLSEEFFPELFQHLFLRLRYYEQLFSRCLAEVEDMIWGLRNETICREMEEINAKEEESRKEYYEYYSDRDPASPAQLTGDSYDEILANVFL